MSLFKSIATFGGFTLISRIMGFIRDMVIAKYLGAGILSDAFLVSFKLPNLFRSLFAEGAFNSAFVPMLSHKIIEDGKNNSQIFSSKAISVLSFIASIFVFIMMIFMPYVVEFLAPGFIGDNEKIQLTVNLSRITFPFLLLISIVSFQSGILNSLGRFAAPASTPIILNIVMIASVFVFMKVTPSPAYSLAIGATTAGFIEVMWLTYFLRKENYHLRPRFDIFNMFKDPDIKTLFRRMAPGVLGAGIYQINIMIGTILVSMVSTGAISWLYYADRLQQLPLGVVGAAIGVALLPILSTQIKSNEIAKAHNTQNKAIEYGAMLSFPAMITLIVTGKLAINVLFQRGAFGAFQTEMTYQALVAYSTGLPFYVMIKAFSPNFFARGDTKTPVKYSIASLLSNLTLSLALINPLGHIGVALATSLSAGVSVFLYIYGLKKRNYWTFSQELLSQIFKIAICALSMGIVLFTVEKIFYIWLPNLLEYGFFIKASILGTIVIFGVASFGFMAKMIGVCCVSDILNIISRRRKANVK